LPEIFFEQKSYLERIRMFYKNRYTRYTVEYKMHKVKFKKL